MLGYIFELVKVVDCVSNAVDFSSAILSFSVPAFFFIEVVHWLSNLIFPF
jgi:hypothetical protein